MHLSSPQEYLDAELSHEKQPFEVGVENYHRPSDSNFELMSCISRSREGGKLLRQEI